MPWIRRRFLRATKESPKEIAHNDKTTLQGGTAAEEVPLNSGGFLRSKIRRRHRKQLYHRLITKLCQQQNDRKLNLRGVEK